MADTRDWNELVRRAFLRTTAVGLAVGGAAATTTAQDDAITAEEIELAGARSGWEGRAPESIADERNPTLRFTEGQTYALTWENADGLPHNFNIEDEEGEDLVTTDIVASSGETQTVEFTADSSMAEYYCAPHPSSMRGDVEVVAGDGNGANGENGASDSDGAVETVVEMPGEATPENVAIDADGSLYFGVAGGEVRRLTPQQTQESGLALEEVERVAELPGQTIGVEVVPDGTLYAAVIAGEETGIWRIPRTAPGSAEDSGADDEGDGSESDDEGGDAESGGDAGGSNEEGDVPAAEPFALVGAEGEVFPNGVAYDRLRDRLLFTESFGGTVYEAPLDVDDPSNAASVWLEDDRLETGGFGANGLAVGPNELFVAVTSDESGEEPVGRVVRVPLEGDGSAGEAETYVEGPGVVGADGLEWHPLEGSLYVAANAQNAVVRVSQEGEVEAVASGDDGLVFPSDVTFGRVPGQCDDLFVCNFAPEEPSAAAILRWTG